MPCVVINPLLLTYFMWMGSCQNKIMCYILIPHLVNNVAKDEYINGLVQDRSNSIVNALELLRSCTEPSIYLLTIINLVLSALMVVIKPATCILQVLCVFMYCNDTFKWFGLYFFFFFCYHQVCLFNNSNLNPESCGLSTVWCSRLGQTMVSFGTGNTSYEENR